MLTNDCRHQKQALTFFRRREMGLGRFNHDCGIWEPRTNENNAQVYVAKYELLP